MLIKIYSKPHIRKGVDKSITVLRLILYNLLELIKILQIVSPI